MQNGGFCEAGLLPPQDQMACGILEQQFGSISSMTKNKQKQTKNKTAPGDGCRDGVENGSMHVI